MTKLLGISGALRSQSTNTMLMRNAAAAFDATTFTEADIRFPLYDGDLEDSEGIPAAVQLASDQIAAADAVIISSPEYNKGISGVLKNALDWISRTQGGPWKDKPVAIMSAAAGRAGGERAQTILVSALVPFQPHLILGPEVLVAACDQNFDDAGKLMNESNAKSLSALMERLKAAI